MANTDQAVIIKDVAVQGSPMKPGTLVTKEQCGASWDKWLAAGAIAVQGSKEAKAAAADAQAPAAPASAATPAKQDS